MLANDPPILIGDEMTGDLDSATGFAIMELVARLNKEGMTVVFVTHDPRMAAFASRTVELRDGRILDGVGTQQDAEEAQGNLVEAESVEAA
ncbi:MAG: hypothetical protein R3E31_08725 [Chloroflexota bacterium]